MQFSVSGNCIFALKDDDLLGRKDKRNESMSMDKKKVWVVGHKHPDTDSICAAIAYANYKNALRKEENPNENIEYVPKRAGSINAETAYVLERFKVDAPKLVSDVGTQLRDIRMRKTR